MAAVDKMFSRKLNIWPLNIIVPIYFLNQSIYLLKECRTYG